MNKHLSLLTAALLLTGASSAFAASQTDLTVTGTITPVACEPTLANGGVVNYGKISVQDLRETEHTPLGIETIQLTVSCDEAAQFAISTTDNQKDTYSGSGDWNFGLGLINGNEKLGLYRLAVLNPVADVPVTTMRSRDKGNTWAPTNNQMSFRDDWVAFGNQTGGIWTPAFVQNVAMDIELKTYIAPTKDLTLTDDVNLNGSATLQIEYL